MKNFFNPKTIAVIGATENSNKVGFALMKNLVDFKGVTVAVNPNHPAIWGLRSYKSVLDYKRKIDLAIIAIPAVFVPKALNQCGKKKIKNVIVISAGFSEIGEVKLEKRLKRIALKHKINLLGPNCFGVCNPYLNLDTTFALNTPKKGNIAFISQSGALWSYISDFSLEKKIGFSSFVSLGNMIGVNFADFMQYFSRDKKTKAIVLYIEKLKDGERFVKIAKRCKKPIFVVKIGTSKQGAKAAISHTGSLATDYDIYRGAFKQAGISLCESLEEAFEKASKRKLIRVKKVDIKRKLGLKKGSKVAIITNAGGAGALSADYCAEANLNIRGPYDILGTALASDYEKALKRYRKSDAFIVLLTPQFMTQILETAKAIIKFKKRYRRPILAVFLGADSVKYASLMLKKKGIPCFNNIEELRKSLFLS